MKFYFYVSYYSTKKNILMKKKECAKIDTGEN